jgi:hypothetical protein
MSLVGKIYRPILHVHFSIILATDVLIYRTCFACALRSATDNARRSAGVGALNGAATCSAKGSCDRSTVLGHRHLVLYRVPQELI